MTNEILTLVGQIIIMFLLMAVGFAVDRLHILNESATKQLSTLLAKVIMPAAIIVSFQRQYDSDMFATLLLSIVVGTVIMGAGIGIASMLYRSKDDPHTPNKRLLASFSNNGFMALPLFQAMFGSDGVFLGSALIVVANALIWSYGVHQLQNGAIKTGARQIIWNPGTFALLFGILLFISPWKLPSPVFSAVEAVGSLNTPLAMLVLGCFLSRTDLLGSFRDPEVLRVSFARLILIPAVTILILLCLPFYDDTARMVTLIGYSTPCAIVCATFAQMCDSDYLYSARAIAVSTLLSIISMPAMLALYSFLLNLLQ